MSIDFDGLDKFGDLIDAIGVPAQSTSVGIKAYNGLSKAFEPIIRMQQEKNADMFLKALSESDVDWSNVKKTKNFERYFLSILNRVKNEESDEKIKNWKNITIRLSSGEFEYNYTENFIEILGSLTSFDISVLDIIYSKSFEKEHFENELYEYYQKEHNISRDIILHSIKKLASNNLIEENVEMASRYGRSDGEISLQQLYYKKNKFGQFFIETIKNE